ncbi:MAG TPA: CoA-binding protein, partial [Prolixibacteraceae bacterium]|nr:CoA-binding protein [Prolixibacteraceae bacterium]
MINDQLFYPKSIVVIGASNKIDKPGGKIVKNLLDNNFKGELMAVNPSSDFVQGIKSYANVSDVPYADLAILAIPASACPKAMRILAEEKKVKAFIVISAGFSEESTRGAALENELVD